MKKYKLLNRKADGMACIAVATEINFNEVIGNILSKDTDIINWTDY